MPYYEVEVGQGPGEHTGQDLQGEGGESQEGQGVCIGLRVGKEEELV